MRPSPPLFAALLMLFFAPFACAKPLIIGHFTVDPRTLEATVDQQPVSEAQTKLGPVADLIVKPASASWTLGKTRIDCHVDQNRLRVRFTADAPGTFTWPIVTGGDEWILPFFEGVAIPTNNRRWLDFLHKDDGLSCTESLSFPAFAVRRGSATVNYILPAPFACNLSFDRSIMRLTKTFTRAWKIKSYEVIIEPGSDSLLAPAIAYRRWLIEHKQFVSLKDKIAATPNVERLIGAPQIYLWGDAVLAPSDVKDWKSLLAALQNDNPIAKWYREHLPADAKKAVADAARSTAGPYGYLARLITDALSDLSKSPDAPKLIDAFPNCFSPQPWGDGVSVKMLNLLHAAGIDRACLTLGSLTAAQDKSDFVKAADAMGYLLGPYDSYNTIHKPGSDEPGETTQFDQALWNSGAVVKADGTKRPGFQKKGYTLNSSAVAPYVARRVDPMMRDEPYTSWFVDCDAFGQYFDDYSPSHPATQADDLAARRARLAWLGSAHHLAVGSEGGFALVADVIDFAQGITTPVIGWGDLDLSNPKSHYFVGKYYPPQGPAVFFKPSTMKDEYIYIYDNPRFRVPLYEAVFHDSVVATHHWSAPSLKFTNVAQVVEMLELLYATPPLYHLNPAEWASRSAAICRHYAIFSPLHRETAFSPLTNFQRLSSDGLLQRSSFGPIEVTANFANESRDNIPPHTLHIVRPEAPPIDYTVR